MLSEDTTAPRKQRHTARRILARLIEEHGAEELSYSTVRDYVRVRQARIDVEAGRRVEVFVTQEHAAGAEAEVDFGELWNPGMIADDLSDYFFARTSGYIGSMMELARMGAPRAIKNGSERITKDLLDSVHIALAAEKRRQELEAALKSGKLHSFPKKHGQPRQTG
jgi:hypothetical protein